MDNQKEFNNLKSNSGFQQSDIAIKYYYFIMHIRFNLPDSRSIDLQWNNEAILSTITCLVWRNQKYFKLLSLLANFFWFFQIKHRS